MPGIRIEVFTPRWGHEDTYTVLLEESQMSITGPAVTTATCQQEHGCDPVWSAEHGKNTLVRMLENDRIFPPTNFVSVLEHIWASWRDGELSDDQAADELKAMFGWLDASTKAMPRTEYLGKIF